MNVDDLLKAHQAIIDAWYANWLKQHREMVEDLFARKSGVHRQNARR